MMKDTTIHIRLSPKMYDAITKASDELGMSKSEIVRISIFNNLKNLELW